MPSLRRHGTCDWIHPDRQRARRPMHDEPLPQPCDAIGRKLATGHPDVGQVITTKERIDRVISQSLIKAEIEGPQ